MGRGLSIEEGAARHDELKARARTMDVVEKRYILIAVSRRNLTVDVQPS